MGTLVNGVVLLEQELWGIPQGESPAQLPAEIPAGGFEAPDDFFSVLLVEHADENLGVPEIRCGVHVGDGDQPVDSGVLDGAQQGCQLPLDFFIDPTNSIGSSG